MIIQQYKKEDEIIHGDVESVDCTIKTDDAKLFHILSNLYSRPLNAVVRELSTNCLDGHRVVGKEKVPFEIRISNSVLDDEFNISFRDFGPGMSKSTIVKVFSTFGESTKINSNLETGCLGLGSKSPFAISSTFMVVSYIDNIKYIYNMSKDAIGRPKITLFNEAYTEEPNGMEITVPLDVNVFDTDKLLSAIKQELHFFKTKPIVKLNASVQNFSTDKKNYIKSSYMCYMVDSNRSSNNDICKHMAVQGEIGYTLDIHKVLKMCSTNNTLGLFKTTKMNELSTDTKKIIENIYDEFDFHLYCKIGELSFAPSREELIYDTYTISNLLKYILRNVENIMRRFHNFFSSLTLPELVGHTSSRADFITPIRPEVKQSFFGNFGFYREKKVRELYVVGCLEHFGVIYTAEEKAELLKYSASYMRKSDNENINVKLNSYGNFHTGYLNDSLDTVDAITNPIRFGETFEVLQCRNAGENKFLTLAALKSGKIKCNDTNIVLKYQAQAGIVFINTDIIKFPSYKAKIESYLYSDDAAKLGVNVIYIVRYNNTIRRDDAVYRFFSRYGVDYKNDLVNIPAQDILDYAALKLKAERENLKVKAEEKGIVLNKHLKDKDEVSYYKVSSLSSFQALNRNVDNSPFNSRNQYVYKYNPDDQASINFGKNLLYIPLDNKNKTIGYVQSIINNIVSRELFKNADGSIAIDTNSIYYVLDDLAYFKYYKGGEAGKSYATKTFKTPLNKKILVLMNEAKAEKMGIRSFESYFERYFLKLIYFKHIDGATLVNSDPDKSTIKYLRIHSFLKMFGICPHFKDINLTKLQSSYSYIASNMERFNLAQTIINKRFPNIESKFYKSDFTTEMFQEFKALDYATEDKKIINIPNGMNADLMITCIKMYNPTIKLEIANLKSLDAKYSGVIEELAKLSKYIYESTLNSWNLSLESDSKISDFGKRIDDYLLDINQIIIKLNLEVVKTFAETYLPDSVRKAYNEDILGVVEEEESEEKEDDATDVA